MAGMRLGGHSISDIFLGQSRVKKMYMGSVLVWDTDPIIPDSISLNTSSLTFDSTDSTKSIVITSNKNWTANCSDTWVRYPTSGEAGTSTINIRCLENGQTQRTSVVYFTCGNTSVQVAITQAGFVGSISISPSGSYYPTELGGSRTITVTSNAMWTVSVNEAATEWLHTSVSSGASGDTCRITCDEHSDFSPRSGTVTFSCGSAQASVYVYQSGKEYSISVNPDHITCSSSKYTTSFDITANCDWGISSSGWIHTSVESGSGDESNITVIIDANTGAQRTGFIAVNEEEGHITTEIQVTQGGVPATATVTPMAVNWYDSENNTWANKQSWGVEFKGGSTNKNYYNVEVFVQSMDDGSRVYDLVSGQTVSVPANGTVYLGLDSSLVYDPTRAQLTLDGYLANEDPYVLVVYGDGLTEEIPFEMVETP